MGATTWKGHLSFGLVSLPVKLCCAARSESISFNQLRVSDLSRIGQKTVAKADDKEVTRAEIIKGYEWSKDQYVVISDEELKSVAPESSRTMEILEFVDAESIDPVYLESSYYVAPEEAGKKPYALLYRAMDEGRKCGIARLVMSNREHIVVIRCGRHGLLLHTLYYPHEVRSTDEFKADVEAVTAKETALARSLVDALSAEFEPNKYQDNFRASILELIEAKKAGSTPAVKKPAAKASAVNDLNAALEASLASLKKSPAPTKTAAKKAKVA